MTVIPELKEHGLLSLAVFRGDIIVAYKSIRRVNFCNRGYCQHQAMDINCELISAGNQEAFCAAVHWDNEGISPFSSFWALSKGSTKLD